MASSDFLLKIDTITGESKRGDGMIDIESFSWGVSNSGSMHSQGGGGAGKASFSDISFSKHVDKSSPALALASATGKHIPKAVLTLRKAGGDQKDYYIVTLEDVLVSSYQASGSGGMDVLPMDSFALNFAKIKWEYKVQDGKGAMTAGGDFKFDLKTMKA